VGIRSIKINYADNVKFIGGIAVWGNGQGSVSYIGNGKCEVTEGDYKTEIKCGTVRTPKGVEVIISRIKL
jgi:hypothetical protein